MKKRCKLCKKLSRVSDIRHRVKMENKLTKLEKNILLSFENERNLNESLAVSAIKSNPRFFYTYAKNNANVKAKIDPLIKNEVTISDPKNIAQVLREQYDSIYSKPDENYTTFNHQQRIN